MCGFYREWSPEGERSIMNQVESIKLFNSQLEKASSENKLVVVQGDSNLCSNKWLEDGFGLSSISNELLSTLALCGMEIVDVGYTYLADRLFVSNSTMHNILHIIINNLSHL